MKKTFKVVMLATEKAENSILLNNSNKLTYFKNYLTQDYIKNVLNSNSKHLYIISDDEIKEGDRCYNSKKRCIEKFIDLSDVGIGKGAYLKIVATTDKLIYNNKGLQQYLPYIPESFIQAYIKAYNESKPITEVDLEIEDNFKSDNNAYYIIKTRPDNTVIVHQSKMYSRDEVIRLLDKAVDETDEIGQWRDRDKWIQDNL